MVRVIIGKGNTRVTVGNVIDLRSIPDGVKDTIEIDHIAKTAKLARKVGEKVFDGTESWNIYSPPGHYEHAEGYQAFFITIDGAATGDLKSISTHLRNVTTVWGARAMEAFSDHSANQNKYFKLSEERLGITSEDGSTARINKFKAWLANEYAKGTPLVMWYELAAPTITNLEYDEVKDKLPFYKPLQKRPL